LDQRLDVLGGARNDIAVVFGDELERAAMNTAMCIDRVEGCFDAGADIGAELRQWPGERHRLPDHDGLIADCATRAHCKQQAARKSGACRVVRKTFHRFLLQSWTALVLPLADRPRNVRQDSLLIAASRAA